ncbi:uncharacterized protein LOC130898545 [Diorhabda carinulata]|uniref:uncharacterized protein LOC130898545 n=1 Tax=Diorhabda carinulata TaxID=1163345 RepID=UPI0025A1BDFE|nr:uncharacterized protein LOC130898545 [Diorhabda carinulata]
MAYLNESHPEVFFTIPRPGGIAKIELPPEAQIDSRGKSSRTTIASRRSIRSRSSRSKSAAFESFFQTPVGGTTREFRVTTAMISSPWALFDDTFEEFPKPPNPAQDVIDLLAITISTIMLLAAGHDSIPIEHQRWTLSYLENIRDEFGNNPPNVTGIINHLKMTNSELESFNDKDNVSIVEDEKEEEEEVVAEEEAA